MRRGGTERWIGAYLFEPYARAANDDVFDQVGVGPGVRLLDVACGSGYAAMVAAQRGAEVSGLDAATASAGPSWPALHELGFEGFRSALFPSLNPSPVTTEA